MPLPFALPSQDAITKIMQAAEALETARYTEFWSTVNGSAAVFDAVPNWRKEIRTSEWQWLFHVHNRR
jgi:hypothetical protein